MRIGLAARRVTVLGRAYAHMAYGRNMGKGEAMVYLWNNHGEELKFKDWDTLVKRGRYRGESATPGVQMWDVDGIRYFTKG